MSQSIKLCVPVVLTMMLSLLFACGGEDLGENTAPQVVEVQEGALVFGQSLTFVGRNFTQESYQKIRLQFEGVYTSDDGRSEPVNRSLSPYLAGETEDGRQLLHLQRFGPFSNPLASLQRPGTFRGTIRASIEDDNGGASVDPSPRQFALQVGPSIIIESLQPVDADCGAPALRAIEGLAYQLRVRAVGITPIGFRYQISEINGAPGVQEFSHDFSNAPTDEDELGSVTPVFFNKVPEEQQFRLSTIRVVAYDAEGQEVETALPISVHRPLEVVYNGKREVAERYTASPVSGCIPGSIGSRVSYSESRRETRQRTVSMTVSTNWMRGNSNSVSQNWMEGISEGESQSESFSGSVSEREDISENTNLSYNENESNSMNFSQSDGERWAWNTSTGESNSEYAERMSARYGSGSWSGTVSASAEGSVPGFAKATGKVSTTTGVTVGGRVGDTEGASVSVSEERGYSMGGNSSSERNFGSTTSESRSQSLSGGYALGSSRGSTVSDSSSLSNTRTWNLSQGESSSTVVSEGQSVAEALTLSDSSSSSSTQSYTGFIPQGRFGIFYRQTTRWVRRAEVRSYDLCGVAQHVGELQFNEYTWAPDLAIGDSCDELPPPAKLPAAACLIPPCN